MYLLNAQNVLIRLFLGSGDLSLGRHSIVEHKRLCVAVSGRELGELTELPHVETCCGDSIMRDVRTELHHRGGGHVRKTVARHALAEESERPGITGDRLR